MGKVIEKQRITSEDIKSLLPHDVFVFGSNLQGQHLGGAARVAYDKFGAEWGNGVGIQGQSYAIPTMQGGVGTIKPYVDEFIEFARSHTDLRFLVTKIGCGIAGFSVDEIAPLFADCQHLENVTLPIEFWNLYNVVVDKSTTHELKIRGFGSNPKPKVD